MITPADEEIMESDVEFPRKALLAFLKLNLIANVGMKIGVHLAIGNYQSFNMATSIQFDIVHHDTGIFAYRVKTLIEFFANLKR